MTISRNDRKDQPEKGEKASEHRNGASQSEGIDTCKNKTTSEGKEPCDKQSDQEWQRIATGRKPGMKKVRIKVCALRQNISENNGYVVPHGDVSNGTSVEHFIGSLAISFFCLVILSITCPRAGLAFFLTYTLSWIWVSIETIVAVLRGELREWQNRSLTVFTHLVSGRFTLAIVALSLRLMVISSDQFPINPWILSIPILGMMSGIQSGVADSSILSKLWIPFKKNLGRRTAA